MNEGKPGLPRGRNRLPPDDVRASHRERLLRSVIAAVADDGYPVVTVADIVRRARVSRAAFRAYLALSGASTELVRSVVRAGQTDALPGLEETILSLHLAVLAARPWTA